MLIPRVERQHVYMVEVELNWKQWKGKAEEDLDLTCVLSCVDI